MELLAGLALLLIATTSALPADRFAEDALINPIYRLQSPANVLVEYGRGHTATAIQPHLFLRALEPVDPTNSLVCRHLQSDYVVFFVPQLSIPAFLQTPVSKTVNLEDKLRTQSRNMPWIIFLKKENTIELPSGYRKINLKSGNTDDPWELGAYTLAPPGSELAEYPDEALAAPPPFFPSLCVGPDKPRPFPVLFAPPTAHSASLPSLASFTVTDLSPAVAPGAHAPPPAPLAVSPVALAPPVLAPSVMTAPAPAPSAVANPPPRVLTAAATPVIVPVVAPSTQLAMAPPHLRVLSPYTQEIVIIDPAFYYSIV